MTAPEFETLAPTMECWGCKAVGTVTLTPHPSDGTHPGGMRCAVCGRFHGWLAKDRAAPRRPTLKAGTIPQVWASWGDHCAHCGLSAEELAILGVPRTVQHAPPFEVAGDKGQLLPLCAWCQQHSANEMKRFRALLERLGHGRLPA